MEAIFKNSYRYQGQMSFFEGNIYGRQGFSLSLCGCNLQFLTRFTIKSKIFETKLYVNIQFLRNRYQVMNQPGYTCIYTIIGNIFTPILYNARDVKKTGSVPD